MSTGWNTTLDALNDNDIINLLGNEYWLEQCAFFEQLRTHYKPTGK